MVHDRLCHSLCYHSIGKKNYSSICAQLSRLRDGQTRVQEREMLNESMKIFANECGVAMNLQNPHVFRFPQKMEQHEYCDYIQFIWESEEDVFAEVFHGFDESVPLKTKARLSDGVRVVSQLQWNPSSQIIVGVMENGKRDVFWVDESVVDVIAFFVGGVRSLAGLIQEYHGYTQMNFFDLEMMYSRRQRRKRKIEIVKVGVDAARRNLCIYTSWESKSTDSKGFGLTMFYSEHGDWKWLFRGW